jgi:hypothetical protein
MANPYARTVRQILNDAFRLVNDYRSDGSDGRTWTWAEMTEALKDTLLDFVRRTEMLKAVRIIPLVADTYIYDLPPDCLRILRMAIHGRPGTLVLPRSMAEYDHTGTPLTDAGFPTDFFRDTLNPDQVGFYPIPSQDGSTTTLDSDYGLIRRIIDEDGNELAMDDDAALRDISPSLMTRLGDGEILRDVISDYGNVQIGFVRAPEYPARVDDCFDADIPVYLHKDFKYGTAARILTGASKRLHRLKHARFAAKWEAVVRTAKRNAQHKGAGDDMRPL